MPVQVLVALLTTLALVNTNTPNVLEAKQTDASMERLRKILPGMKADCLDKIQAGGTQAMPRRTDQCFTMTKPRRWRGIWLDAFEGQRFCPAPARSCLDDGKAGHIWISFPDGRRPTPRPSTGRVYAIEFVGRRTLLPGFHGHMGVSAHEMVVDRLISIASLDR